MVAALGDHAGRNGKVTMPPVESLNMIGSGLLRPPTPVDANSGMSIDLPQF
jgi:hypothetical protein